MNEASLHASSSNMSEKKCSSPPKNPAVNMDCCELESLEGEKSHYDAEQKKKIILAESETETGHQFCYADKFPLNHGEKCEKIAVAKDQNICTPVEMEEATVQEDQHLSDENTAPLAASSTGMQHEELIRENAESAGLMISETTLSSEARNSLVSLSLENLISYSALQEHGNSVPGAVSLKETAMVFIPTDNADGNGVYLISHRNLAPPSDRPQLDYETERSLACAEAINLINSALSNADDYNGPTPEDVLMERPTIKMNSHQVLTMVKCEICMNAFREGDSVKGLICQHFFHVYCLAIWFEENFTCPKCGLSIFHGYVNRVLEEEESLRRQKA